MSQADANTIREAIVHVLENRFRECHENEITDDTDLVFDLGLDSVQLMRLLVALESEHRINIPDSALQREDISTIKNLAASLAEVNKTPSVDEPELDIKVHCLVSCLCEAIRNNPRVDHRPFYFGVWDAEVFIDERGCLSYHSEKVDHRFFIEWFEKLYAIKIQDWYEHHRRPEQNLETLACLLAQRRDDEQIMVMLDLYQLPERENKFNKNPFPHYVLLENTRDPENIWMWDPDFRWQGELDRERVFHAIAQPCAAGGYRFFARDIQAPDQQTIAEYFEACMQPSRNVLTEATRQVLHLYTRNQAGFPLAQLDEALRELPVLAIRKYAYEHGLAFFWRELNLPEATFEAWCERIEELVRGFDKAQFLATRFCSTEDTQTLDMLRQLLARQDAREFQIKQELGQRFEQWRRRLHLDSQATQATHLSTSTMEAAQ